MRYIGNQNEHRIAAAKKITNYNFCKNRAKKTKTWSWVVLFERTPPCERHHKSAQNRLSQKEPAHVGLDQMLIAPVFIHSNKEKKKNSIYQGQLGSAGVSKTTSAKISSVTAAATRGSQREKRVMRGKHTNTISATSTASRVPHSKLYVQDRAGLRKDQVKKAKPKKLTSLSGMLERLQEACKQS